MSCEDYPCCGHEWGDCPDPDAEERGEYPLRCVECGGRIKHGDAATNAPSMHRACMRRYLRQVDEYGYCPTDEERNW